MADARLERTRRAYALDLEPESCGVTSVMDGNNLYFINPRTIRRWLVAMPYLKDCDPGDENTKKLGTIISID